ncbi:hypothetical protein MXB_4825 [Myxobolus squamalis]|nr:hypothetical protein MXB_4825 [Myxobolus squamalis]
MDVIPYTKLCYNYNWTWIDEIRSEHKMTRLQFIDSIYRHRLGANIYFYDHNKPIKLILRRMLRVLRQLDGLNTIINLPSPVVNSYHTPKVSLFRCRLHPDLKFQCQIDDTNRVDPLKAITTNQKFRQRFLDKMLRPVSLKISESGRKRLMLFASLLKKRL